MLERERIAGGSHHWVRLGTACDNRCLFCLDGDSERDLLLPAAEIKTEIERGRREHGAERLILSGGEPTLHPAFAELVHHGKACGYTWVQTITNGARLADRDFLAAALAAGLDEITFSLHGHTAALHDHLTARPGSFRLLLKALLRARRSGRVVVNADVVICRDNIDPEGRRARANRDAIARLHELQLSLELAMTYLQARGRSFRAERVPLCFMPSFAWASTETRKIVKGEQRSVYFLDQRRLMRQYDFEYPKAEVCEVCSFDSICAGLYSLGRGYDQAELCPMFADPVPVVAAILGQRPAESFLETLAQQRRSRRALMAPGPGY
jgi:MoaA/NifB/PqqE/SkfB family radical SAM enzyme